MANKKSAEKQARVAERRRSINRSIQSLVKNQERKIRRLTAEGNWEEASKLFPLFQSKVDKASKKGVFHSKTGDRRKQRVSAVLQKALAVTAAA